MIKHFCDKCGTEITDENQPTGGFSKKDRLGAVITTAAGDLEIEVSIQKPRDSQANDICKLCLIGALVDQHDRPAEKLRAIG